jgi:predicted amidophosphoribosyltransferase
MFRLRRKGWKNANPCVTLSRGTSGAMTKINPQRIAGKWKSGVALDVHTLSSVYLGVNEHGYEVYDTTRSEIGELLFRLKYRSDMAAANDIVAAASAYLKPHLEKFDLIVPVPPSGTRPLQPVITLAKGIGAITKLPVVECVTLTRSATELKGVIDVDKRNELLAGLHAVDAAQTKGKRILLFDDLFRSGSTMNVITEILMGMGEAASVSALTITRTRSNQ